jgi:hypothetical protein
VYLIANAMPKLRRQGLRVGNAENEASAEETQEIANEEERFVSCVLGARCGEIFRC